MVILFSALITFGIFYEVHNIFYEKWPLDEEQSKESAYSC